MSGVSDPTSDPDGPSGTWTAEEAAEAGSVFHPEDAARLRALDEDGNPLVRVPTPDLRPATAADALDEVERRLRDVDWSSQAEDRCRVALMHIDAFRAGVARAHVADSHYRTNDALDDAAGADYCGRCGEFWPCRAALAAAPSEPPPPAGEVLVRRDDLVNLLHDGITPREVRERLWSTTRQRPPSEPPRPDEGSYSLGYDEGYHAALEAVENGGEDPCPRCRTVAPPSEPPGDERPGPLAGFRDGDKVTHAQFEGTWTICGQVGIWSEDGETCEFAYPSDLTRVAAAPSDEPGEPQREVAP